MRPNEARVLIIEDDERKRERLKDFVQGFGGEVVGEIADRETAHQTVRSSDFPNDAGNPNVVLIDGNLDEHGRHGTDGMYIFKDGYREGKLHRVDKPETLGAVAIGCSIDERSDVAFATGGNICPRSYDPEDNASERWVEMLEPHPAQPDWLSEGVMERQDWGNFGFGEMLNRLLEIEDGKEAEVTVTVIAGRVKDAADEDGERKELEAELEAGEVNLKELVDLAGKWAFADEDGRIKVGVEHAVEMAIQFGEHHAIISHSGKVIVDRWANYARIAQSGSSDKLLSEALPTLPDSYKEAVSGLVEL